MKCEKCGALGKILPPTSPNVFTNQDNAGASGQQGQQKKYATVFFFGGSALTLTRVLSRVGPLERVAWPTDVVPQPLLMPTEIPMEKIGDIPKAPSGEIAPDGNPTDDAIPSDKVETPESKKPKVEKIDPMEPTDNNERLRDYWEDKRDLDRVIKGK